VVVFAIFLVLGVEGVDMMCVASDGRREAEDVEQRIVQTRMINGRGINCMLCAAMQYNARGKIDVRKE